MHKCTVSLVELFNCLVQIILYLILSNGQILKLGSEHGDPDRSQNLIPYSFYHLRLFHRI